jgi:hypothetical protein
MHYISEALLGLQRMNAKCGETYRETLNRGSTLTCADSMLTYTSSICIILFPHVYNFGQNMGRVHLLDAGVDGIIIFKLILTPYVGMYSKTMLRHF